MICIDRVGHQQPACIDVLGKAMSGFLAFGVMDGLEDSFSPIDRYPEYPSRRGQFICRHTCTACDSPNALVRSQYETVLFLHNASLKRQAEGIDALQ